MVPVIHIVGKALYELTEIEAFSLFVLKMFNVKAFDVM